MGPNEKNPAANCQDTRGRHFQALASVLISHQRGAAGIYGLTTPGCLARLLIRALIGNGGRVHRFGAILQIRSYRTCENQNDARCADSENPRSAVPSIAFRHHQRGDRHNDNRHAPMRRGMRPQFSESRQNQQEEWSHSAVNGAKDGCKHANSIGVERASKATETSGGRWGAGRLRIHDSFCSATTSVSQLFCIDVLRHREPTKPNKPLPASLSPELFRSFMGSPVSTLAVAGSGACTLADRRTLCFKSNT
jgi:hypothetical protein